jgi:hypothetical protein
VVCIHHGILSFKKQECSAILGHMLNWGPEGSYL